MWSCHGSWSVWWFIVKPNRWRLEGKFLYSVRLYYSSSPCVLLSNWIKQRKETELGVLNVHRRHQTGRITNRSDEEKRGPRHSHGSIRWPRPTTKFLTHKGDWSHPSQLGRNDNRLDHMHASILHIDEQFSIIDLFPCSDHLNMYMYCIRIC